MLSGLTTAELESILAHELAHIRRYDYLVNLLQAVVETVLFYHPAVWWLSHRIRAERENCCDDIAVEVCGDRVVLAQALARLEEIRCGGERLAVAANGGSLLGRIRRIVGAEPASTGTWWPAGAIVLVTLGLLLGGLWMTVATADPVSRKPDFKVESNGLVASSEYPADDVQEDSKPKFGEITEGRSDRNDGAPVSRVSDVSNQETTNEYIATGRVIDSQGKAVPGAELYSHYYKDSVWITISATCDADGKFELRLPEQPSFHRMFHTWVYAPLHGVRVVNMSFVLDKKQRVDNLEIKLPENNRTRYRVFLPDGSPAKGAVLSVATAQVPQGCFFADKSTGLTGFAPAELKQKTAGSVNYLGEAFLEGYPGWALDQVQVEMPGFGIQKFSATNQDLKLASTGKVRLEVNREKIPGFAGVMASLETRTGHENWDATGYVDVRIDESGVVEIPELAAGTLILRLWDWKEPSGSHPWVEPRQKLDAGDELVIAIEPKGTVPVTGVVLTADTSQPVAGSRISIRNEESRYFGEDVYTDEQGRFALAAIPGPASLDITVLASENAIEIWRCYRYPDNKNVQVGLAPGENDNIEILLPRKPEFDVDNDAFGWGDLARSSGIRSKLTLLTAKPEVGQPLLFKLEVKNFGDKPAGVDPQIYATFRVLRAKRVGGEPAKFIGMTPQTMGVEKPLLPGESLTLWKDIDANDLFLLDAGRYEFFAEGGQWAAQAFWRDSNTLTVEIGAGLQLPLHRFIAALDKRIPEGWELSADIGAAGGKSIFLNFLPPGLERLETGIQIWFTDKKLADDFEQGQGDQKQIVTQLGQSELGFMNVAAMPRTPDIWPEYLAHVRKAANTAFGEMKK